MSNHTSTPWSYWPESAYPQGVISQDKTAQHIAVPTRGPQAAANAERIVACVNACEGIDNPQVFKDLIEAARKLADKSDAVGDCDHKRATCKEVGCIGYEIALVRQAIKALGVQS